MKPVSISYVRFTKMQRQWWEISSTAHLGFRYFKFKDKYCSAPTPLFKCLPAFFFFFCIYLSGDNKRCPLNEWYQEPSRAVNIYLECLEMLWGVQRRLKLKCLEVLSDCTWRNIRISLYRFSDRYIESICGGCCIFGFLKFCSYKRNPVITGDIYLIKCSLITSVAKSSTKQIRGEKITKTI